METVESAVAVSKRFHLYAYLPKNMVGAYSQNSSFASKAFDIDY